MAQVTTSFGAPAARSDVADMGLSQYGSQRPLRIFQGSWGYIVFTGR